MLQDFAAVVWSSFIWMEMNMEKNHFYLTTQTNFEIFPLVVQVPWDVREALPRFDRRVRPLQDEGCRQHLWGYVW